MTKQKRRVRLFGTGQAKDRFGGGMPTPSMVSQMLEHLQDNGPTPIAELIDMVERRHHKRERLELIYHKGHKLQGDAYALFIDDLIAEFDIAGVAVRQDDRLALGPAFALGIELPLPEGMGTTVYAKAERELISRASLATMEIKSLADELRRDRPGIRTINKDNVERLAASMRAFGYMSQFPIWLDQYDRVLSGRHRILAAEAAGVQYAERVIDVASDLEALAIAYTANEGAGFSKAERERIAKRLSAAGHDVEHIGERIGRAGMRLLIEAKLLAEPERSGRSIARELKVDHKTVGAIKAEIQSGGEIPHLSRTVGDDLKSYPAHKPKTADPTAESQAGKVLQVIRDADQPMTAREITERLPSVDRGTVSARLADLEKAGHVHGATDETDGNRKRFANGPAASVPAPPDKYELIVDKILKLASDLPKPYYERIINQLQTWSVER